MACMKIPEWDWKKGGSNNIWIGNMNIELNYFTCGVYYFDGKFKVVKFPKGMQIYHGSGTLANANVEFPLGSDYYTPVNVTNPDNRINLSMLAKNLYTNLDKKVETATSEFFNISPGWFADPRIARGYSLQNNNFAEKCGDKCVNVYELIHDAVFILLDNDFNIWRLINSPTVPNSAKDQLKTMYNLKNKASLHNNLFGELFLKKERRSYRNTDIPFSKWLCKYISSDYAGYAANTPVENYKSYFHLEFMFCNPLKWLNRNFKNTIDWQYNNYDTIVSSIVKQFIEQMSYYKSTNVNWHAGNLLEHSIWCLLFAEQLMFELPKYGPLPVEIQKKIATAALLHDIGKMAPNENEVLKRNHDYIYYTIPNHPKIGSDYIRGTRELPLLDKHMNKIGVFNVSQLVQTFGFTTEKDIYYLSKIIDLHWDFGSFFQKWESSNDRKSVVDAYVSKVGKNESFLLFVGLLIVSMADIMASQPFGMNNLTSDLNHKSRFFPFIKNVPKKYRGGITDDTAKKRRSLFAISILDAVAEIHREVRMKALDDK